MMGNMKFMNCRHSSIRSSVHTFLYTVRCSSEDELHNELTTVESSQTPHAQAPRVVYVCACVCVVCYDRDGSHVRDIPDDGYAYISNSSRRADQANIDSRFLQASQFPWPVQRRKSAISTDTGTSEVYKRLACISVPATRCLAAIRSPWPRSTHQL